MNIKEKIDKYINERGILKTPAHYVKELFNDIINKVYNVELELEENIILFDTNKLNIDTKNGYYYNENLLDSIKITMIDDIIQPRVEFNGLSPKIELPKNIIVNNKLINYNGIGKYVLSFNNNTCDIERYKCDLIKAPSGYIITTYDSDMLGDGYLSYNGEYSFISLDRDYTTTHGPILENEKFITYVGTSIEPYLFENCALNSIVIPNSVNSIGEFAFTESGITSVEMGNSIKTIGQAAFGGCTGLTSITIPNSVTSIGEYAFAECYGLTSVKIGNSVTSIDTDAFAGCELKSVTWNPINYPDFEWDEDYEELSNPFYYSSESITSFEFGDGVEHIPAWMCYEMSNLKSIKIPNSVTSIGIDAFEYCTGLTSVEIGNSVTCIGEYAFYDCSGLTSVIIPDSVTSIDYEAFRGCSSLASIEMGNSVTEIGEGVFSDCSGLTSIIVDENNTVYDSRDNCNAIIETETNSLILGCKNTIIPNSVAYIGGGAFGDCIGLTSITIPNSVTSIGDSAFSYCSGLTSIEIPDSVTSIGDYAFSFCDGLTSIIIPDSVTSIGDSAFYGTPWLENQPDGLIYIGKCLYEYKGTMPGNTHIDVREGTTQICDWSFQDCSGLTSVTIPDSVTSIGSSAFGSCSGLTSITIPNSVTSIGRSAFYGTPWLENQPDGCVYINNILYTYKGEMPENTHIDVREGTTQICGAAFGDRTELTSITIPNSVASIDSLAFSGCSGLTSITIPNSVTSIGGGAFEYCSELTSVEIGNSITSIDYDAFYRCSSLISVTLNSTTPPTLGSDAFAHTPSNLQIYVPDESVDAYKTASRWKSYASKIKPLSEKNSEPEPEMPV